MSLRHSRWAALGFGLLMAGCGAIAQFDTNVGADGVIKGALSTGAGFNNGIDANGALSQSFDSKGVSIDHISSVKLKTGTLAVTTGGQDSHLGYLKSLELDVSANGMAKQRIGHIDQTTFETKPTSATVVVDDVELKPFIAAGGMTVSAVVESASKPATGDVGIHLDLTFHVVPQL